jgi:hypothetical protein
MLTPALPYPTTAVTRSIPDAVVEKTINKRVLAATGMANPVIKPLLIVPMATKPESDGAKVTRVPAIGLKILLVPGALYS